MKRFLIGLCYFVCSLVVGAQNVVDSFHDVSGAMSGYETVSLNGVWKFHLLQASDSLCCADFFSPDFRDEKWESALVPGCWESLGFLKPRYVAQDDNVTGLYRTTFTIPRQWNGSHVFLRFDGVLRGYCLWVNGKYVGKWESAYNACQFDVTPYLKRGENVLAVRVYTKFKGWEFDSNDDWGPTGIFRDVSLFAVPDFHVKECRITTDRVCADSARIAWRLDLSAFVKTSKERLLIRIKNPDGKEVYSKQMISGQGTVSDSFFLKCPRLWTAETPNLYHLDLFVGRKQRLSTTFGVREITIDKNVLLLNGQKIKLRGVNLHETCAFTGKVVDDTLTLRDLQMMKQANVNFIRCSHYPRNPSFYEMCDSMGFYVVSEVPFGYGDEHLRDDSYLDILLTRADATVRRDINHPCIILWSIGNENPLTPITEATGRYVKRLDPTRPICYPMVHNYFLSLDFKLPDFVDVFAPHYPRIETMHYYAEAADRPVVFTEYCHSLGQSLELHKELWETIEENDNLAGGAVWEWVDQGMVCTDSRLDDRYGRTEKIWLKDSTCIMMEGKAGTDGLLYPDRTPLSNYYEVRKNYAQAMVKNASFCGKQGPNIFPITIENRFDFANLADVVRFDWALVDLSDTIDNGFFTVDCPPGHEAVRKLSVTLPHEPSQHVYILQISVHSGNGWQLGEYTIPVRDMDGRFLNDVFEWGKGRLLSADSNQIDRLTAEIFDHDILLRAGRKLSLSEEIREPQAVAHYLIRPQWGKSEVKNGVLIREVAYRNSEFASHGHIGYQITENGALNISVNQTPSSSGTLLLEAGCAFLLNKRFDQVSWIGNGPHATYPGKNNADNYGFHSVAAGDLYFEGNRMGVDLVAVTDISGDGYIFISPEKQFNFEQTDRGIVLTVNQYVSGLCSKQRPTAFPVYADPSKPLSPSVTIMPIRVFKDYLNQLTRKAAFNPFITQYDTYLLRLKEILGD